MRYYKITYGIPYVADIGDGQKILWEHESFVFCATDDSEAQKTVKYKMESNVVELICNGEKQLWHYGLFYFEEVPRKIEFPELPGNCKQLLL